MKQSESAIELISYDGGSTRTGWDSPQELTLKDKVRKLLGVLSDILLILKLMHRTS